MSLRETLRRLVRARELYGASWGQMTARIAKLHIGGMALEEAIDTGLLDPVRSMQGVLGKRELLKIQARLNPTAWAALSEDKAVFSAFCHGVGVRVPTTYAVFDGGLGWGAERSLSSRDEWIDFFERHLPTPCICKPAYGAYGERILRLDRAANAALVDHLGTRLSGRELHDRLASEPLRKFVFQSVVRTLPLLEELSGTSNAQTLRISTYVNRRGEVRFLEAILRIVNGDSLVDNFRRGRTGNLSSQVDLATGKLAPARTRSPSGIGLIPVTHHPKTGRRIEGLVLPGWDELLTEVRRAAVYFSPLRTLGWDVVLTPDGPTFLETNMWWDPFNLAKREGNTRWLEALEEMRGDAKSAHPRSPWDYATED